CRNFIKATLLENPKIILNTIYQFYTSLRKVLPEKPEAIDKEIYEILPFELPIVKRSQTKAITNILHTIFNFDTLLETYFITLPQAPDNPTQLKEELKKFFPITDPRALRYLTYYRNKLADHYSLTKIPSTYFDLPPPKEPLPLTYYQLNSRVRYLFPIDPNHCEFTLQQVVELLCNYYFFKRIPNDFFKQKPILPSDPKKIKTISQYIYSISDDSIAKDFLQEVSHKYKVRFPIHTDIMTANPMDKPKLPDNPKDI